VLLSAKPPATGTGTIHTSILGKWSIDIMVTTENIWTDLLPTLRSLSRADKIRAIQLLAGELAREEEVPRLEAGASFPIWTPFDAFDAAAKLFEELKKAETGS
jgi:hypothetical protein